MAAGSGRCREVKALLSEYIDGELQLANNIKLRRHLESCKGCRDLEASLRRVVSLSRYYGRQPAPPGMRKRLFEALRRGGD